MEKTLTIYWDKRARAYGDWEIAHVERLLLEHDSIGTLKTFYICQEIVLTLIRALLAEQKLVFDKVSFVFEDGRTFNIDKYGQVEQYPKELYVYNELMGRVVEARLKTVKVSKNND